MTHAKAYVEAGYAPTNENSSNVNTIKVLRKPHVKEALDRALVKHGITLDTAIAPIGKSLTAMKMNEFTGEITEDLATQLKGSDRALKLMGIGQDKGDTNIQNFGQMILDQRDKYIDE